MSLLRELAGFAGEVRKERTVIPEQGFRRGGGNPVGALITEIHPVVWLVQIVRTESGTLQVLPIDGKLLAFPLGPIPQFPILPETPRRDARDAKGTESAPVIGGIKGEHRGAFLQPRRAGRIGIIPAMPEAARTE